MITTDKAYDWRGKRKGFKAALSGVDSYLLQGEGTTTTEAKEDLLAKAASGISRMVQGPWIIYSPYPEHPIFSIVTAGLYGYQSITIDPREGKHPSNAVASGIGDRGGLCIHGTHETDPRKILRQKRIHMAQLLMDVTEDRGMAMFDSDYLGAESDRKEHASYLRWQDEYKRLESLGMDSEAARRILAGYSTETEEMAKIAA